MIVLILGLVIFLGIHSVQIAASGLRNRKIAELGEGRWKGIYSIISLIGLVLIIWGYGLAREAPVVVWDPPVWTRHLSLLLMLPVFPLLFSAYFPGRIKLAAKHPMLLAVKFWALAHLLANGTLADLVLFGSLLAWAVVDRISVKRRPQSAASTVVARPMNDVVAVVAGVALYLLFAFYLHLYLFGVAPIG